MTTTSDMPGGARVSVRIIRSWWTFGSWFIFTRRTRPFPTLWRFNVAVDLERAKELAIARIQALDAFSEKGTES